MSTPYTCPLCGYRTVFGNPASIQLHATVSHSGKTPITEVAAPIIYTFRTRTGVVATETGMRAALGRATVLVSAGTNGVSVSWGNKGNRMPLSAFRMYLQSVVNRAQS